MIFPGFDKFIIGDFLSKEKNPNAGFAITNYFIGKMDFRGDNFLTSFRFLLSRMNLPKDSTLILNIIDVYSNVFFRDSHERGLSNLYKDPTAVYLLSSTILALNTMLHKNIPNMRIIEKKDFIKMNSNIDKLIIEEIYDELKINKLDIVHDYNELIYRKVVEMKEGGLGKTGNLKNTHTNFNQGVNLISQGGVSNPISTERGGLSPSPNLVSSEEMIGLLKLGQTFLKYGNKGKPHERFVYLSQDEKKLLWKPLTCTCFSKERYIKTEKLTTVYMGTSNSQILEKYNIPPDFELNCFSIIGTKRSLDLRHEDQKLAKKWYQAIKYFIKRFKSMSEVRKKKLKELSNRKEIISDFWRTEILPNWEQYRKFLLIKGNNNAQNIFFSNNEFYRKKKENLKKNIFSKDTSKNSKLILEEKDKQDVVYLWTLGIPEWLRKKLWYLVISNDLDITENMFNFFLKRAELIEFEGDAVLDRKNMQETTPGFSENPQIVGEFDGVPIVEDTNNKMIETCYKNLYNPLLNEIILDVHKSYKKFEKTIKLNLIEEKKFKEDLFKILRCFVNFRCDITYTRQIAYIASILYLNSDDYFQAFVLLSNFIIPSFLLKFLTREEIFIKVRCEFFESLLVQFIPSISTHFKNLDIHIKLFFYDWIEYVYTKTFKYETLLRIWDCYLAKGEIFLYELALSIIKLQEKDLINVKLFIYNSVVNCR